MITQPTTDRFHVDHTERALTARRRPGQWIRVRSYRNPLSVEATVRRIRAGTIGAYQPAGRYDADMRIEPDSPLTPPFALYIRYRPQEP